MLIPNMAEQELITYFSIVTTDKLDEIGRHRLPKPILRTVEAYPVPRRRSRQALVLLLTLMRASSALAQVATSAEDDPWLGVEQMIVTGAGAADLLTQSTQSVTRFDADLLKAKGVDDISDLAGITPNLEIRTADATSPTFFIRGVGLSDFNANAGGAVAVYQDGVAMNLPALQLGQLFDIGAVEILRGPQGAGAGRNASAGAIKVTSRMPSGEFGASFSATYGNYDALEFEGALDVPIIAETLSARFSFTFSDRDGWGENGCAGLSSLSSRIANAPAFAGEDFCGENPNFTVEDPPGSGIFYPISPVPGGLKKNVNDVGNWAARAIFHLTPQDSDSEWSLIARGGRTDQLSTLGQAIGTGPRFPTGSSALGYADPDIRPIFEAYIDECRRSGGTRCNRAALDQMAGRMARGLDIRPERGDYNRTGQTKHDTWGVSLRGEVPLTDEIALTSTTAFDRYDRFREQDADFTPDPLFESVTDDDAWQFWQEVLVERELGSDGLSWQVGGYFLMEELDSQSAFTQLAAPSKQEYEQDTWSFAVHAGLAWEFLEAFTFEAGARYNWEKKDFAYTFVGAVPENNQGFLDSEVWQAPSGVVSLRYAPTEDLSFYWKYSRGWKGGQFNASATRLNVASADPETIDAFEIGFGGSVWEERIGMTGALFFYQYQDYQVFVVENNPNSVPQEVIINANDVSIYGAELEARLQPLVGFVPEEVENFLVTVRFGWLESEYLDFTQDVTRVFGGPGRPARAFPVTADYSGNRIINAPQFKLSVGAEWEILVDGIGDFTPRYDGSWSDEVFFGPNLGRGSVDALGDSRLPKGTIGQKDFWLHDVSLRYRPPIPNFEILVWVRNATNEEYKTFSFDGSFFANWVVNFVGEPRTYGATASFTF